MTDRTDAPGPLDWGTDEGLSGIAWLLLGGALGSAAGVVTVVSVPLGIYPDDPDPMELPAGWFALGLALTSLVPLVLGVRGWLRASRASKRPRPLHPPGLGGHRRAAQCDRRNGSGAELVALIAQPSRVHRASEFVRRCPRLSSDPR